jgi:hypothetical protein
MSEFEELTQNMEPKAPSRWTQNLCKINRVIADHTNDVDSVLDNLRQCETIALTDAQISMAADIQESVTEHHEFMGAGNATRISYLVRYGMLLERENHKN